MYEPLNLKMDKDPSGSSSTGSRSPGGFGLFGSAGPQYSNTELSGVPCKSRITINNPYSASY